MTQALVISARGLPNAELESMLEDAASGSEVTLLADTDAVRERMIDPDVAVAIVQGVSTILVPFATIFAAKLFKKEPEAKLEVKHPAPTEEATSSAVTVIVASQSPEEQERLLTLHLRDATGIEIVLPD